MHAVVVRVSISDFDTAVAHLRANVIPQVSQAPGLVTGHWLRPEDGQGLSVVVFESEDAARQAAERVPNMVPESVTIESVEVREVVASVPS